MAVINWTDECILRIQGIVLFLVLCGASYVVSTPRSCEDVKVTVRARDFTNLILDRPGYGEICGDGSCCSNPLEKDMQSYTHLYAEKFLRDSILRINSLVDNRAKKFDEFFLGLMNNSKLEFHNMFKRTYGKIYIDNSDVFSDFFLELETYYKKGTVGLSDTMDRFFAILFQRMFIVMNAQYNFDERYMECVAEHMAEMKPFGDVSHKLSIQLRRAFVATRTFHKALQLGATVSDNMINFKLDEECTRELTKMQFCGICRGMAESKACSNYCTDTLEKCLRGFNDFSTDWDNMIDAIDKVGDRLLGPYNVEAVVEPMNIKISEAIMNFQEAKDQVSKKIYALCGKPSLSRAKRKAEYKGTEDNQNLEVKFQSLRPKKKKHKQQHMENVDSSSLEKIILEIKIKIKDAKKFWSNLRYQYCNNESISSPPTNETDCRTGSFQPTHASTPPLVNQQSYLVNAMTDKLKKAFQGQEVELVDEESMDGSGSGSGDGIDEDMEPEPEYPKNINHHEEEEPVVIPEVPSTSTPPPEVIRTSSANPVTNKMCLSRALVQYVLPIVLAWFGGAITDLL